ncbi:MAG: hypothetical protein GQ557_00470 [Mycoplasmataceae bacterium]|nr:hypothetical protein [Mycoplasmataceae bacterium]
MMQELFNQAIVLNIKPVDENAALGRFLLDDGRIIFLKIPGYQNPQSKHRLSLQLNSIVELEYFQNVNFPNSGKLKRATLEKQLVFTLDRQTHIIFLLHDLLRNYKKLSPEIYQFYVLLFTNNNENILTLSSILFLFLKLIQFENFFPNFNACANCQTNKNIDSFSLDHGGLLCVKCAKKFQIKSLQVPLLKKIIMLGKITNYPDLSKVYFLPREEIIIKEIFGNYLEITLGINTNQLKNI